VRIATLTQPRSAALPVGRFFLSVVYWLNVSFSVEIAEIRGLAAQAKLKTLTEWLRHCMPQHAVSRLLRMLSRDFLGLVYTTDMGGKLTPRSAVVSICASS